MTHNNLSKWANVTATEAGELAEGCFIPGNARTCVWAEGDSILELRLEVLEDYYRDLTIRVFPGESRQNETYRQSFCVTSDRDGTEADGYVEIYVKNENTLGIRIRADLTIGPEDWGGVAFYLPAGCILDSVKCTYPEKNGLPADDPPVNVWTTAAENEKYTTMIEIGRDRSKTPGGGGVGEVLIEASCPRDSAAPNGSLTFGVDCGAEEKDGYVLMGVSHTEITVDV